MFFEKNKDFSNRELMVLTDKSLIAVKCLIAQLLAKCVGMFDKREM
jgi:hypothetical protein